MEMDSTAIPAELQAYPQWVVWRYEVREAKPTKVPYVAGTLLTRLAHMDQPATWRDFATAWADYTAGRCNGTGFVFTAGDPYFGVDIDHALDADGHALPAAMQIIRALGTYTEYSPSGQGLHIIGKGTLPPGRRRRGSLEMYDRGRYFTMTGRLYSSAETYRQVHDRQDEIEQIHATYLEQPREPAAPPMPVPPPASSDDDQAILDRMMNARNGARLQQLWSGDTGGYASPSEADLALCNSLAFWTGRDPLRMDALFRRSGLYRPKWDERHYADGKTYGQATIDTAIANTTGVYTNGRTTWDAEQDIQPPVNGHVTGQLIAIVTPPPTEQPVPKLSAYEILTRAWPEAVWVIDGILPVGLASLGGLPKLGKSWLALQAALAISTGATLFNRTCTAGKVWYLALEDYYPRLFRRMTHQGWPVVDLPVEFTALDGLKRLGEMRHGGIERLLHEIEQEQYLLTIIDTVSRIITGDQKERHEVDPILEPLQTFAQRTGRCILLIDHHRKSVGLTSDITGDSLMDTAGSVGKAGTIDTGWNLYRKRGEMTGKLAIAGRDIEKPDLTLQIAFNPTTCVWEYQGESQEIAIKTNRDLVYEAVAAAGQATLSEVAKLTGIAPSTLATLLLHMVRDGFLMRDRFVYRLRDPHE